MRVFLYARVSKAIDQNPENQLLVLRKWAEAAGHVVVQEYVDEISSRDTRPAKEECMKRLRLGEADAVAVIALDRWGRDMAELVMNFEEFISRGMGLISLKEGLNLTTATGKLHAHILSAFANFERERIRERTLAGLARAKAWGKIGGRHPKGCGCGYRSPDGKVKHDGPIKPVRDSSNMIIGWKHDEGLPEMQKKEIQPQG